ncbi:ABC transporter permease [Shimazuella sp. AN120528]|uniref:ABC transporter permease n=1 Tax=Shimazuella soli TaxID=1892854 RepID=UPI001F10793D|nr:ABC transporter permease [Shimazuella soli]MCH5585144.1 ABC transporter permease [Shimazuella soli]
MIGLITNEMVKIFRQLKMWGVLGICFILILLSGMSSGDQTAAQSIITLTYGLSSFLFLPLLVSLVFSDSISNEVSQGTIKLLIVQPISRIRIWISKWIAGIIISWSILFLLAIGLYLFVGIKNGFGSWSSVATIIGHGKSIGMLTIQMYGLQLLSLISIVTFILALSTFIDNASLAFGISMAIVISTSILLVLAQKHHWQALKFLFAAQWMLPGHLVNEDLTSSSLPFGLTILGVWMVLFLLLSLIRFSRRDFS